MPPAETRKKRGLDRTLEKRQKDRALGQAKDIFFALPKAEPKSLLPSPSLSVLERHPTLVLNADYQPLEHLPLSLWSWQDTVKAVFSGRVTVVEVYPDVVVRASNVHIPLPSVIALNVYIPQATKKSPPFSRRHVFLRDGYCCQYCLRRFSSQDLSLDHVLPRSRGGRLNWENAVASCRACNARKSDVHPDDLAQIGMRLHRTPWVPTSYEMAARAAKTGRRELPPAWEPYVAGRELAP